MATLEPDLLLLQRFKETQDADAFSEIVSRYAGAVFSTCQRILHDPGSAEDATQETFFRLMTRPQKVTASLGGWLHRAATRLALDIRRSETSRRRREAAYLSPLQTETQSWADVAPKLDAALARLPEAQRELLVRHFLNGQAQAELANEAGTSPATLSRRMKSAIDALRAELAERGVGVTPAVLMALLGKHGSVAVPVALKSALGKMILYCSTRTGSAASAKVSLYSILRGIPRMIYAARWAFAAVAFCLLVATLLAMLFMHIQVPSGGTAEARENPAPASPVVLVQAASRK